MRKDILVLAKSWKEGGFCIAGLELTRTQSGSRMLTHNWIRPVLPKADGSMTGAIPHELCASVSVLDIVTLDGMVHAPTAMQPENWLVPAHDMSVSGCVQKPVLLQRFAHEHGGIWHDARTLRDDQVAADTPVGASGSLRLIAPADLVFSLQLNESSTGIKRRISAAFTHEGRRYSGIPVTEPALTRVFKNQFPHAVGHVVERRLNHGDRYCLTLSLSPVWKDGNRYILGAAVIDYTGYLNRTYG
ncbi:hypothetical protein BXT89_15200 [Halopseudomonas pachastrellae]|uniref:Dual OB-containing domain-containing protein n=1 Tax=Halopseudomonas pachastrellae TaxID=254161 RepID=A0A1S8DDF2_9GAMM|nr:hypothetical protein [Halopseudomonas pachastrellae]ONM43001.1 hypothetical protein BXT89_15200 [Halopseudomonas pachastrellae]SFM93636.1 hypothetical protein SAMN05216256_12524 [Halopseudomonas pachastrellae]